MAMDARASLVKRDVRPSRRVALLRALPLLPRGGVKSLTPPLSLSPLSLESKTDGRSPEVSSTAFDAQPLDLHSVHLMDWGFAAIGQLARTLPASHPVLVHRLASLLRASFRPRLAAGVISPLRFATTSPPSGCKEDLHLQAVDHARHTKSKGRV